MGKLILKFLLFTVIVLHLPVNAQSLRTYKDENIIFKYDNIYRNRPMTNTTIVVNGVKEDKEIMLVKYDETVPEGVDGWNSYFHKKVIAQIKHWGMDLKDLQNTHLSNESLIRCSKYWVTKENTMIVLYAFVVNQTPYLLCLSKNGKFSPTSSSTPWSDKIAAKISTIKPEYDVKSQLEMKSRLANAECPVELDETSYITGVSLENKKFILKAMTYEEGMLDIDMDVFENGIIEMFQYDDTFLNAMQKEGWKFYLKIYNPEFKLRYNIEIPIEEIINKMN